MLYQLSYASPEAAISLLVKPRSHPENAPADCNKVRAHQQLRTYHGTESKVSTGAAGEQENQLRDPSFQLLVPGSILPQSSDLEGSIAVGLPQKPISWSPGARS